MGNPGEGSRRGGRSLEHHQGTAETGEGKRGNQGPATSKKPVGEEASKKQGSGSGMVVGAERGGKNVQGEAGVPGRVLAVWRLERV